MASTTANGEAQPSKSTSTSHGIAQVNSRPTTFITANTPAQTLLSLAYIRSVLVRLEDTICFLLIERAQFAHNQKMYIPKAFPELVQKENWPGSWLTWFLKETEATHAKVRRWQAPDEWPYTALDHLPQPILPSIDYPHVLHQAAITLVNDRILEFYQSQLVPGITARWGEGADDGQYGSAAICDCELLAALSRRIHFGMFVSESKFQSAPASFIPHILAKPEPNRVELAKLITKPEVEAALLVRLEQKASVYGQDLDLDRSSSASSSSKPRSQQVSTTTTTVPAVVGQEQPNLTAEVVPTGASSLSSATATATATTPSSAPSSVSKPAGKIDVNEVVKLYHQFVIPITKDVEVEYLVKRLDGLSQDQIDELMQQ
ncbi:unnamed protein product [Tilletia controversa]|nr:hypothetical protein CF328_g8315 [Tilletia controversa]CAD6916431.1 unnamed protein product [Tilletia controversa]CAD6921889.1 unnamed protein product [Tilletia controversa]CAD6980714.1 unnamed protein product [Tilletia controversa]